ncbi:MAG TPA: iron hydrogenase small subunit [Candidatus Scatomonas merdigallinarum]|nr:iron hydrogenase small subunit [Candidatus Scatomonas merdigallinarum]
MVKLIIDGREVNVPENTTILEAAASVGIKIPTLCYLKNLNEIGACRICMVEIEGYEKLFTACNNPVREGMVIHTNSRKVWKVRRNNLQLLLSQHDVNCALCVRNGNCSLQTLASEMDIRMVPFDKQIPFQKGSRKFPLIKDYTKCIKCMRCIQVCDKVQTCSIWDVVNTGSRATVDVKNVLRLEESDCTLCGQCLTHCPVGALIERDDTGKVWDALDDPEKIVVVQIAPSVRAAWGEDLGLKPEFATVKRLAAALRQVGFDYIFDTDFSADLTIMEEASEFLEKLKNKDHEKFPMFTSCCPGWVRFVKGYFPEFVDQVSTAKSPQQMFGAIAKSYYAKILNVDPSRIFSVSIMPCISKKQECALPVMNDAGAGQDVDVVLTTREIDRMIKAAHIIPQGLKEEELDMPLGLGSGAGVIFGATGGVMEAALRTASYFVTGKNPDPDAFRQVRGMQGWREAEFDLAGQTLKVAMVNGLGNARKLLKKLKKGKVSYDFVEVMACPGGCVGGGGQPIHDGYEMAPERGEILYRLDRQSQLRFSHENPSIKQCYADFLGQPLSERAHHLLHTDHHAWKMPGEL